jgi:hypothetical protein
MREGTTRRRSCRVGALTGALASLAISSLPLCALAEGTSPEDPPEPARKLVLVVPTRVLSSEAGDRATFDLLLATALQELGFTAIDSLEGVRELDASGSDLAAARDLYLGLKLEAALEAAKKIREAHLSRSGDLLGDPGLTDAELVMMRILLDLGQKEEAAKLADQVLAREPEKRLDPVDNPPSMQALWISAIERRVAYEPEEHDVRALAAAANEAGAAYAVACVEKRGANGAPWLVVQIAPASSDEKPSRHPLRLGLRGSWAREVQGALELRFGPLKKEAAVAPVVVPPVAPPGDGGEKKVWYKTWWFWTTVGIVVVGGVAIGVGAWASADRTNDVTSEPLH